jgi:hypothetical protein
VIACPEKDCDGKLEASCTIYLDIEAGTFNDEGEVTIEDMRFSHLNDHLDGQPFNVEELTVSCDHCGREFAWFTSKDPAMADRIAPQPIGNAPRTTGVRGGL